MLQPDSARLAQRLLVSRIATPDTIASLAGLSWVATAGLHRLPSGLYVAFVCCRLLLSLVCLLVP